ncbi:MAG: pyridoxine 5'-phosphate synthase [Thiotrichales bacterium]|jgi:pyridoxine 5-phosphate synthase|nr:pyridoxine 5'-phosphate synthase [Thiotrichales bacterium]MBT4653377.1 pyridoxine 5'-phosphate synthase [Thiotrichales bacterium]MBT5500147.1 pyridoxine 5'-phosphate synthase [Thiotrichales bacterium]MBT5984885.1 pyridoxine 5'-phosphate synthase [Thiotrichales bacterium]MBT6771043.1 pyridoxine 5'-phosphate synthase [Thiotrichales bacterium]
MSIFLGVNIDHIATLRQARGTRYPSLVEAAKICENSGADSITLHLREDRRHIQDNDVEELKSCLTTKMNLEMAATDEMLKIATKILPEDCCLVPEKRQELTTEGGLDVASQLGRMKEVCSELNANNIKASLFIDADNNQIEAAVECGAPIIEIHTGHYADASTSSEQRKELKKISNACNYAHNLGLQVNAGHGLTLENTKAIAEIGTIVELNIGHSIISRALFIGLSVATSEMKQLLQEARRL